MNPERDHGPEARPAASSEGELPAARPAAKAAGEPAAKAAEEVAAKPAAKPVAKPAAKPARGWRAPHALPRTFQGRLSLAFVSVFAVAVGIVSVLTVFVLNNDLRQQEQTNLGARARAVAAVVRAQAETAAAQNLFDQTVVSAGGVLNVSVRTVFQQTLTDDANQVALADLRLRFGFGSETSHGTVFIPADEPSAFTAQLTDPPGLGQARDSISYKEVFTFEDPVGVKPTWMLEVSLSAPYTTRDSTIAAVVGFLALTSLGALVFAIVVSSLLARRFTAPLRRLTEAARALAEGDLDRRVPADRARTGATEITELSRQFNAMAAQVQETMDVIVRDRDRGREFLADVSHELRTPLAALRTFNELLQEKAGEDVAVRAEFLESSAQQIERLDWLAQNLLELSKLDSGLVRLDLRPDDLRATVLSAVEQAEAAAHRRGVSLTTELPEETIVVRHDPPRIGQMVSNLVGNALKFTPRGGSVKVTLGPHRQGGARIQVIDTGVGIDATELPRIFDRFYRGSRASEARSSGSGLGLAIVRSIVDMHGGRIAVESRVGAGSTFTVTLPADPRTPAERAAATLAEGVAKKAKAAAKAAAKGAGKASEAPAKGPAASPPGASSGEPAAEAASDTTSRVGG
jgi:signal transduction histidine kinase